MRELVSESEKHHNSYLQRAHVGTAPCCAAFSSAFFTHDAQNPSPAATFVSGYSHNESNTYCMCSTSARGYQACIPGRRCSPSAKNILGTRETCATSISEARTECSDVPLLFACQAQSAGPVDTVSISVVSPRHTGSGSSRSSATHPSYPTSGCRAMRSAAFVTDERRLFTRNVQKGAECPQRRRHHPRRKPERNTLPEGGSERESKKAAGMHNLRSIRAV